MERQPALDDLLRRCTVRLELQDSYGTGFFVAPGLIMTAAHVIKAAYASASPVSAYWNDKSYTTRIVEFRADPDQDLALLEIDLADHPCVFLSGEARPFNRLYSYGYPTDYPGGAAATFEIEGVIGDQQNHLKFQQGQVQPGMSGAPLLNWETGGVCGIVQYTRDRSSDLGGDALLTKRVLQEFPQLIDKQKQFHQQHKKWAECLTPQQRQVLGLAVSFNAANTIEVFYSYAEEDEKLVKEIQKQLVLLKRLNIIADWYPGKVTLEGEEPDEQILKHLNSARIILLLVSPDFVFSEEHGNFEVQRALERHKAREVVVIPINLRNIDNWQEMPFGRLQAIPRNGKPVIEWSNRDAAFAEIAREIRGVVERLKSNP